MAAEARPGSLTPQHTSQPQGNNTTSLELCSPMCLKKTLLPSRPASREVLGGEAGSLLWLSLCLWGKGVMTTKEAAPALHQADTSHQSGHLGQATSPPVPQCPHLQGPFTPTSTGRDENEGESVGSLLSTGSDVPLGSGWMLSDACAGSTPVVPWTSHPCDELLFIPLSPY